MKINKFKSTFSKINSQNQLLIFSNAALISLLSVSLYFNASTDKIVLQKSTEYCSDLTISSNSMNEANHRRLGYMLSGVLGNITPENSEYISNIVLEYASPDIYQTVKDLLAQQLRSLKIDEVTMTFTPKNAFVEDGITFVTGQGTLSGPTGKRDTFTRTYEFEFNVENYNPTFDFIDAYDESPRDRNAEIN